MGFDETSIRRAHGALQVADAGLLAEWMLERPENEERSAAAVCINEAAGLGYPLGRRRSVRSENFSAVAKFIPERLKHASEGRHRHCKEVPRAEWRRRLVGLDAQGRGEGAAGALRRRRQVRGAAHAVSSHLRDVLDKIAVEDQPMSPLTDDAGDEEEKNEESPERQLASPGASRRVSMASPVVSPAPAPAPRRRGGSV